ncbi:hypothetical protein KM043_007433 [Ampulex compressa]|nr:hypothetical protein KM043_007433 [Ampulex compressa]
MTFHMITSEIFAENRNTTEKIDDINTITEFSFRCPSYLIKTENNVSSLTFDDDNDVDVDREKEESLLIEHSMSTELNLVGLQLWRGALLLADYILSNPNLFKEQTILELGSGVGLTSIVASFLAKEVICTDISVGGILKLIQRNVTRNNVHVKSEFYIEELNFLNPKWSNSFSKKLDNVTIILAADVIYDDKITDGFVCTLAKLLSLKPSKVVYVALEKRYVFTVADMETNAPMYEEFLLCIKRHKLNWLIEHIKIDFPQYFKYERVAQLVLLRIRVSANPST